MTKRPAGGSNDSPLDLDQIRELIDLLIEKDVGEFQLDQDGVKVKIRRNTEEISTSLTPVTHVVASPGAPAEAVAAEPSEIPSPAEALGLTDAFIVTSPMVGTFYRAPEPDADAFTDVGEQIEEGQPLCIVEAMKLLNEIVADVSGEVVAIFVENAEPVEYGQQLFAIQTKV